jgi:hypothetical protein
MQYDGSAPTIATRQLPRSGFVQEDLCGAQDYAESGEDLTWFSLIHQQHSCRLHVLALGIISALLGLLLQRKESHDAKQKTNLPSRRPRMDTGALGPLGETFAEHLVALS